MAKLDPRLASTVPELFARRAGQSPDAIAYTQFDRATKQWTDVTWLQMHGQVEQWKRGFAASDLAAGDRVAVLLDNGLDWVRFDQAALAMGLVTVPLFSTDSPENWAYILRDSEPNLAMLGKRDDWNRLKPLSHEFPSVKIVICVADDDMAADGECLSLENWLTRGTEAPSVEIMPEALATITYSSGTTGHPKGVMLSHRNMVSAARSVLARNSGYESDVFLAFLPMAHVFARTVEYYLAMMCGARLGFARSVAQLSDDLMVIRPTILMGVPRIYERAWTSMESSLSASRLGRWIFKTAVALYPIRHRTIVHRLASRAATAIIRKRVLARFGGRLRLTVSGSAPLSGELASGLRAVGMPLVEGYGMAEAAGPVSGDAVSDYQPGTVGRLLDNVEARLSDSNELLIRSVSVMQGYWGKSEESAKAIDRDGWLRTGDLAEWVGDRIKIVGRVHEVIGTATGEKLAPSDVEFRITSDALFDQAVVVGNNRPFIVGLVVLNRSKWVDFAAQHELDDGEPNSRSTEKLFLQRIAALTADLPNYARVRRLYATLEPWTAEAGLATVTINSRDPESSSNSVAPLTASTSGPPSRRAPDRR